MRHMIMPIAAAFLILAGGSILPAATKLPATAKPNIVLIVGDDMGYADVGFHGCRDIPTPHLDALAASGVKFTNGYVSGPYCSPTRAGLLTGRYQQRFGHEFNPNGMQGLPTSETTLADRLKAAGYQTGLVGKWHLGAASGMHPQQRGFDEFFGFLPGAHDYFSSASIMRGTQPITEKEYLTDAFGREAVAFIDRHRTEPFFLYLAFNAVHTPMQADDARLAKFKGIADRTRRTYAAMMFAMDEAIGKVRAKLTESGLDQNTLVMFVSDNGGPVMSGTTTNGSNNAPLRGSKRTTLEGGVRVPFLVTWPSTIKPSVYEPPAIQLDLHATALAAAGVDPNQTNVKLDGVDLTPFITGKNSATPHEELLWRFGAQMAIRVGDYKLVRYDMHAEGAEALKGRPISTLKLYRLSDDIGEANDLASTMPEKVRELQSRWDTWNKQLAEPLWGNPHTTTGGKPAAAGNKKAKVKAGDS